METNGELNFLTTLLPFSGIVFVIAIGVVMLNQQFRKNLYRQQLAQEELKNRHQQDLLRSSIQVQEDERKRIAQDLHDELGAVLSIIRMHMMHIEQQQKEQHPELLADLQNVRSLAENALASMRRISHELMPLQLETFGLVKTLESLAIQADKTGTIQIQLHTEADFPEPPWPQKLGLYRICMELIHNTIKHGEANLVTIHLSLETNNLVLTYTDNGKGLTDEKPGDGLGLKGMEGRINSLGGSFYVKKGEGRGFYARVTSPFVMP